MRTAPVIDTVDYDPQILTNRKRSKMGYKLLGRYIRKPFEDTFTAVALILTAQDQHGFARGYYTGAEGAKQAAEQLLQHTIFLDESKLVKWRFDTMDYNNKYISGQGNHSMSAADVDYDELR